MFGPKSVLCRRLILLLSLVLALVVLFWLGLERETWQSIWNEIRETLDGRTRVGLQIGHLDTGNHPEELASLRYNTGGVSGNRTELGVNKSVAYLLRDMLLAEGLLVDILPATVPRSYRADVFISLHADSSPDPTRRGYKSAYYRYLRNKQDPILKTHIDQAYFYFSGLPDDDANVSGSMLEYYAFNHQSFKHALAPRTPALLVEMGYISNDADWEFIKDPVNPAYALKMGILSYLRAVGKIK